VAAVLSGPTLVVTSRRDERRWRREAIIDTLVIFLDASFVRGTRGTVPADIAKRRRASVEAHDRQLDALTRLRLLAPNKVVVAAEQLHQADHEVHDRAFADQQLSEHQLTPVREAQARARNNLLDASRTALGLGPAQTVGTMIRP
jgi:hypothetical protein